MVGPASWRERSDGLRGQKWSKSRRGASLLGPDDGGGVAEGEGAVLEKNRGKEKKRAGPERSCETKLPLFSHENELGRLEGLCVRNRLGAIRTSKGDKFHGK